jgi:PKD repeat protein
MGSGGQRGHDVLNDLRRGASLHSLLITLARAGVAGVLLLLVAGTAVVAAADVGHKDFVDTGGSAVTGSKPESKLWYNDGIWWAAMQPTTSSGLFIYKLDPGTDSWVSTGVQIDNRSSNHLRSDTLWDGAKLYIASQIQSDSGSTGTGSAFDARLYRFSYNSGTHTYSLDNGFPAIIRSGLKSETLVIAKDSTGELWATWTQPSGSNRLVYVNHTVNGNDASWSTPAILPIGSQPIGVTTDPDDISTIIAFKVGGEHRIGVFWSNQADQKDYFAWRVDGTPDTTIWTAETALSGTNQADDHVNIKTDASGQLYVVVKTSLTGSNPLIKLLRRTTTGSWANVVVGIDNVGSNTRPILELEENGSGNILHVFMTGKRAGSTTGQSGGDIFEKTSPVSSISFPSGSGTQVIHDGSGTGNCSTSSGTGCLNDVTSTKQNFDATMGIVVLAFDDDANVYWHNHLTFGPPPDPLAGFTAAPTSGTAALMVNFTNTSTGTAPLTYAWDFGDPGSGVLNTSTATNPSHVYQNAGTYTVKLTTTNGNNVSDTVTQTNLITVSGPTATITLTPDADAQVRSDSPTTNYGALDTIRTREDPGTGSTYREFLRFNVQGLTGTVTDVKLRLYPTDASPNNQNVYVTLTNPNWIETGTGSINWNNAPAIGSTLLGSASVPNLNAYNDIPLSTSAITGNGLVTFAIKSSGTNSAIENSKEHAAPTNPPQLVITQSIGPSNTAPTANATSKTTNEDIPAAVDLSGSDPDLGNCELTFAIVTPPSKGSLGAISSPANNCVSGNPNTDTASVTYTPSPNANGSDSFTYTVNDGITTSAPATASLTITPVNDTPTAGAVNVTAATGTPKVITLTGGDVETCDLTFTIVSPPSSGSLAGGGTITNKPCVGTGPFTDTAEVTYTATSGSSDSFTYKVTDGNSANSSDATVTITITPPNATPTADPQNVTTDEDIAKSVTLSGTDAETCGLTFVFSQPTHGTVGSLNSPAGCASGSAPFPDSATVTYTPTGDYNGSDSFTYTVNDGTNASSPATVSITVNSVNDKPTADAVSVSTTQDTSKIVTLTGHDVEDCTLTFTPTGPGPSHGTLGSISNASCTPGSPNTDTATITYTPTSGYTGSDSFTYKVTDTAPFDSSDATVTVTVNAASPTTITLNPVADAHVNSGSVNANYGTLNPIRTREGTGASGDPIYRPYFQFNVPSFSGTVQSVKLRLYVTTASAAMTQSVYLVGNGWTETGLTWTNAPALPGSSIGSGIAGTGNAYVEFTLTTPISPSTTYSFALKSSGTTSVYFSTREDATNKPQLVIVTQ